MSVSYTHLDVYKRQPLKGETAQVLIGRPVKGEFVPLNEIVLESGNVTVWGEVFDVVKKESWDGKRTFYSFYITDKKGSIILKPGFVKGDDMEKLESICPGMSLIAVSYTHLISHRHTLMRPFANIIIATEDLVVFK